MKRCWLLLLLLIALCSVLNAADELNINGLNETSYIYRTAQDSLHSYFRDAFSFAMEYKNFTFGMKFLAELPKYNTDQSQLMHTLDSNRLTTQWTERYLEYANHDLLLHGGNITESFGSGMVFRCWQDLEFDTDTRIDGFLVKYDKFIKLKALYGALPNLNQPTKNDLVYGADAEAPLWGNVTLGASALTLRTLTPLGNYNQQDVFGGRTNWSYDTWDGNVEYAATTMMQNGASDYPGSALEASSNVYLQPFGLKSLQIGGGYKKYDKFRYRLQDLRTFNYDNETLADNEVSGQDEEGGQGILALTPWEGLTFNANYGESWNRHFSKRMNDLYTGMDWQQGEHSWLVEYTQIEKLDKTTKHWQKEIRPDITYTTPLSGWSLEAKAEYKLVAKQLEDTTNHHTEPYVQLDLGKGKLSVSTAVQSWWITGKSILKSNYWANCEVKYAAFENTDLTLFVGKQAGGKVCRNGICKYVAAFQGVRAEITTRF